MTILQEKREADLLETCVDSGLLSTSAFERGAKVQAMSSTMSSALSERQLERINILGKELARLKDELELLLEIIQHKSTSKCVSVKS